MNKLDPERDFEAEFTAGNTYLAGTAGPVPFSPCHSAWVFGWELTVSVTNAVSTSVHVDRKQSDKKFSV